MCSTVSTPLRKRLDDILKGAIELSRWTDLNSLFDEASDLLGSLTQLANENNWKLEDLVEHNIEKILRREKQYTSLGRKISVAILGGAFDPIHRGHIELAKFVLDTSGLFDEVWLMPCFRHMYNKRLTDAKHRLAMCRSAASVDGRIKTCDFEIKNELAGETYNTVNRILGDEELAKTCSFSMVIGMDNANNFDSWVNFEDLERLIRFVVVPRKGQTPDPKVDWYLKTPHVYLSPENDIPEISSTHIRNRLARFWDFGPKAWDDYIGEMLHDDVHRYIVEKNLYKESNDTQR